MKSLLFIAALLALEPTARSSPPRPPMTVTVAGPSVALPGREIEVVVEIRRLIPDRVPILLAIEAPGGVTLVGRKARETIIDDQSMVIRRTLRISIARVPRESLKVVVDQRTRTHGVHATAEYRFGRPPPKEPEVRMDTMRGPGGSIIARSVQGITPIDPKRPTGTHPGTVRPTP